MRTIGRGLVTGVAAMAALGWWGGSAMAFVFPWPPGPSPAQRCEAAKNLAAGAKALCLASESAKAAEGKRPNFARCEAAFTKGFAWAEKAAGPGVCPTEGDTAAIETMIDVCMADVASALAGNPPPPPCPPSQFPATGQTTCWNSAGTVIACAGTGQDGDIRAGAVLSYTDNGDGTITDNNTGLMWEKKSDDGSIHDKDTNYTWDNAFAVHIAGLNAGGGFAGHTDWRLPNIKELPSIVNYANVNPTVSPAFNTGCVAACTVLTCSCTAAAFYWSSSTFAGAPTGAWAVLFNDGNVDAFFKSFTGRVRAVRGGL